MPVIPAPERLRQEDSCEFKTRLDHMVSPSQPRLLRESLSGKKGKKEKGRKKRKKEKMMEGEEKERKRKEGEMEEGKER